MSFSEQLSKRKENDRKAMRNAYRDLSSIFGKRSRLHAGEDRKAVSSAIEDVLSCLGVKAPDIPEGTEDVNLLLEYILDSTGVMSRRVKLTGKWWKNTKRR